MRPRLNGAKSWELAIAHTFHLSRTRGPEILYTLPRVARGGGMLLVAVALLTLQGGGVNNGQHRRGGHTSPCFGRFVTLLPRSVTKRTEQDRCRVRSRMRFSASYCSTIASTISLKI